MSLITTGLLLAGAAPRADDAPTPRCAFVGLTNLARFERTEVGGEVRLVSPWIDPGIEWNELVPSWNALCPTGVTLRAEVRADSEDGLTSWYDLGLWCRGAARDGRRSVRGQKDARAELKTDTLLCRRLMKRAQVRFTLRGVRTAGEPRLKCVGLSFLDATRSAVPRPAMRAVWGRVLDVPARSQLGHDGADGWCSPTCVSMVLAYWAERLERPELDVPVPEVARGIHDPNWPGTGNWAFNAAYAGHFDGMRAVVARLRDLPEVEEWVATGVPVPISVSFDLLVGKTRDEGGGHLIVVVGFTADGDVVINDPWPESRKENRLRKTVPRRNVERAWQRSRQTAYLMFPETLSLPGAWRAAFRADSP